MKAVVDAKSFINAVTWVTKSYAVKNDRAYVCFNVKEDGSAYLSHANLDSYMKSFFTVVSVDFADGEQTEVEFAIDGKYLQRLASALASNGEIVISKSLTSEKTSLDVKTSSGKFTVPLLTYKAKAEPETVVIGEVDDNEFFDSMQRVAKLCDPANTGSLSFIGSVDIGFDVDENLVKLFATDRYAMGEIVLRFSPNEDSADSEDVAAFVEDSILLPQASALLVHPTKGVNTSISIIGEKNSKGGLRFGYSFPDGRVALFSLLNAPTVPSVEAMKKKARDAVEYSITVPTAELTSAIRVVSSLAWDEDTIDLNISKKGLIISDSNAKNKLKVSHSEIEYDVEEDYSARFVRPVINEAFSPIATPSVRLKWGADSSALVLAPITEDGTELETVFVMAVISR